VSDQNIREVRLPGAAAFKDAFLESYKESRAKCSDLEWDEIWTRHWNDFMLRRGAATWRPRAPDGRPVLALTAEKLGLAYSDGEPLRMDAVFCAQNNGHPWFPMVVAIEHENDPQGFKTEIAKLLSVRCRLKVGITYTADRLDEAKRWNENIRRDLAGLFDRAKSVMKENGRTEYLFLAGTEGWQGKKECKWFVLEFFAHDGLRGKEFELVHDCEQKGNLVAAGC